MTNIYEKINKNDKAGLKKFLGGVGLLDTNRTRNGDMFDRIYYLFDNILTHAKDLEKNQSSQQSSSSLIINYENLGPADNDSKCKFQSTMRYVKVLTSKPWLEV